MNDSQGRNVSPIIKGGSALRGMKPGGKEEEGGGKKKKKDVCGEAESERVFFYFCVGCAGPRLAAGLSRGASVAASGAWGERVSS